MGHFSSGEEWPRFPGGLLTFSPGNFFLMDLVSFDACGVFCYLTPGESKLLSIVCFDVRVWAEVVCSKYVKIPLVETDPDQAAMYRLWGPYHGY